MKLDTYSAREMMEEGERLTIAVPPEKGVLSFVRRKTLSTSIV
jgi:hypothetical protein